MTKKELKNLAKQIAKLETIIQTNENSESVREAQNEEIKLMNKFTDVADLDLLDDLVQQYMQEE
jgi:short-subunit dehydrogenase involved in D-alanine esterification of teichoic acids